MSEILDFTDYGLEDLYVSNEAENTTTIVPFAHSETIKNEEKDDIGEDLSENESLPSCQLLREDVVYKLWVYLNEYIESLIFSKNQTIPSPDIIQISLFKNHIELEKDMQDAIQDLNSFLNSSNYMELIQ